LFKNLVVKELLLSVTEFKFAVYAVLCVFLLVGSYFILQKEYEDKYANHTKLVTLFYQKALDEDRYTGLTNKGVKFSLPPPVLQVWCVGTETQYSAFVNIAVSVWRAAAHPFVRTEESVNPALTFFPVVDLSLIVTFVLSLMVFIFSHNVVSHEREQGTLKLLLSYPVTRSRIILAKLTGGYMVILLPVLFSFLVCLLIAGLSPFFRLSGPDLAAFGVIALFVLLYLLVLYFLGIFVSILCRRSSTAIAVLLLVWLVFIIVVHNLGLLLVEKQARVDSIAELLDKQDQAGEATWEQIREEARKRYNRKDPDEMNEKEWQEMFPFELDLTEKIFTTTIGDYLNTLTDESRRLDMIGYFSPSLLFMSALTDLADTGVKSRIRTLRSILDYHQVYKTILQQKVKALYEKENKKFYEQVTKGLFKDFSTLQTTPTPLKERMASVVWKLFTLLCYAVFFFLAAYYCFIKTEIL
jgi:ABC-type transport system involved in multi-copper enzyme maturation permease subunit